MLIFLDLFFTYSRLICFTDFSCFVLISVLFYYRYVVPPFVSSLASCFGQMTLDTCGECQEIFSTKKVI